MRRLALALTLGIFLFGACTPVAAPQVTVKELTADKAWYAAQYEIYDFTHGVVVYLSEKKDFFVITGDETLSPADFGEDDYIIVKASTEGLNIGDILTIQGGVNERTVTVEEQTVTVQYLSPMWSKDAIRETGKVDITDPDFEKLISAIREEIDNETTTFLVIWLLFLNPNSPFSPLNPNRYKPPN